MSLRLLAAGTLVADPQRREGTKGAFATATIRVQTEDDAVLVSTIAFGDTAERLLALSKGDAVSVAGRAKPTSWTGRDGAEKHGLSVVADQIATARPQRRPADSPRRAAQKRTYPRQQHPPARPDDDGMMPADGVGDLWREGEP